MMGRSFYDLIGSMIGVPPMQAAAPTPTQLAQADPFAADRAARALRYLSQGAGVNQGDQRGEAAAALDAKAQRAARSFTQQGTADAASLSGQAARMRDSGGDQ